MEKELNNKQSISVKELINLKNNVIENFSESDWIELGALTNKLDEVEKHPRLLRSLRFGDDDYEGLVLVFLKKMIDAAPENYRVVKSYITGEDDNSIYISSSGNRERTIVFSPNIFSIPDETVEINLVSVMMPFSTDLLPVYKSIQNATSEAGLDCRRADDIWEDSTIIQDIFSLIFKSHIVICDFSGKNPNVFYEAGIAHTLGKHVIPITQYRNDVPFDLQHHRFIQYLNNNEGLKSLENSLISRLKTLQRKQPFIKSSIAEEDKIPF